MGRAGPRRQSGRGRVVTADQHLDKAREYLEYAHRETGRDSGKAAAYAAIATAHATLAQAMRSGR